MIKKDQESSVKKTLKDFEKNLINEYKTSDNGLKVLFKKVDNKPEKVFTDSFERKDD